MIQYAPRLGRRIRPGGYKVMTTRYKKTLPRVLTLSKAYETICNMVRAMGARPQSKGKMLMSNYTDSMVAEMVAQGSWNFAEAQAYAEKHNLSTRSVVSKIKSLDLDYTPKPKAAASGAPRILKMDHVTAIAKALDVNVESIEGLAKADSRSLSALLMAIN